MIHTVQRRRSIERRLDRLIAEADAVREAMRCGAALCRQVSPKGPRWNLSTGRQVSDPAARMVIRMVEVVGVDGALLPEPALPETLYQTWRYIELTPEEN